MARLFTNDLIDEANNLRQDDVIRQARDITPEQLARFLARHQSR